MQKDKEVWIWLKSLKEYLADNHTDINFEALHVLCSQHSTIDFDEITRRFGVKTASLVRIHFESVLKARSYGHAIPKKVQAGYLSFIEARNAAMETRRSNVLSMLQNYHRLTDDKKLAAIGYSSACMLIPDDNKAVRAYTKAMDTVIGTISKLPIEKEDREQITALCRKGYVPSVLIDRFATEVKRLYKEQSDDVLSFADLSKYSVWFAVHPAKAAGQDLIMSSKAFPLSVNATQADTEKSLKLGILKTTMKKIAQ